EEPEKFLDYLVRNASDRKLRLFCLAGCRRIWHWILDEACRAAVEVAEKYVDGLASAEDLEQSWNVGFDTAAARAETTDNPHDPVLRAAWAAVGVAEAVDPWWGVSFDLADVVGKDVEFVAQTRTIRDIFGNPFRPVTFNPTWRTATVTSLA